MLISLLLPLAFASPSGEDLPAMAKNYGWATVASVVHSAASSDESLSEIHANLRGLGLDRLQIPVEVDPSLSSLSGLEPFTGCGWNQGVACSVTWPLAASPGERFVVKCFQGKTDLDIALPLVIVPPGSEQHPSTAHLQNVLPCWDAGGDRVRLVPLPSSEPTRALTGIEEREARLLLDPFAEALSRCAGSPPRALHLKQTAQGPSIIVREGQAEHVQGTACARRALEGLRALPEGASITLSLPLPW